MDNVFSKVSEVNIKTKSKNNKAILDDVYFTAPFKIMKPFYKNNDYMNIMIMSSSAGIMAGDKQEYNITVGENTKLEITSQAYEKIHKMSEGKAFRNCYINVEKNSLFKYNPQPTIPFAQSSFENTMKINLKDLSSKLILIDIISCGRSAYGEKFKYNYYKSYIEVKCSEKLIYRDNTLYDPKLFNLDKYGFFEGYDHLANILICNYNGCENNIKPIVDILEECEEITGGATLTKENDICIKILGFSGQKLSEISEKICSIFE